MSNGEQPKQAPWGERTHRSRLLTYSVAALACVAIAVGAAVGIFDGPQRVGLLLTGVLGLVFFLLRVLLELRRR